jgi:hypothetical protein
MNVKELKEFIQDLPDDMQVFGRGYENGFDEADATIRTIAMRKEFEWYDGQAEEINKSDDYIDNNLLEPFEALIIV